LRGGGDELCATLHRGTRGGSGQRGRHRRGGEVARVTDSEIIVPEADGGSGRELHLSFLQKDPPHNMQKILNAWHLQHHLEQKHFCPQQLKKSDSNTIYFTIKDTALSATLIFPKENSHASELVFKTYSR